MKRDVLTDRHVREGEEQEGGTDYTPMKNNFGCSGCPITIPAAEGVARSGTCLTQERIN